MPGPGASEGRPAKKAPAAKKASDASKTVGQKAASPAKRASSASSTAPVPGSTPAKKATAKAPGVAKRSPSASPDKATGASAATTHKSAPKKTASSARPKAPSEREVIESRFFKKAKTRAEKVFSDPEKMRGLAAEAANKSQGTRSGPLTRILDEVAALVRLVVAYARGTYRAVPAQSMLLILAGLVYFVSPVDLVPDFIPVAGYMDDAVVLGFVIRTVREELEAFMAWETGQGGAPTTAGRK